MFGNNQFKTNPYNIVKKSSKMSKPKGLNKKKKKYVETKSTFLKF